MAKSKLTGWQDIDVSTLPAAMQKEVDSILKMLAEAKTRKEKFSEAFFQTSKTLSPDEWGLGWNYGKLAIGRQPADAKNSKKGTFSFS